ncbi:hypothetical protein [Nonomuraea endophytica]|uniref:Cupin n=1 Tax=Nonomuraea endophytica TaxID=714136 RepID=A0A7W8EF54_9ACTN|nr:hypothetical protein [Nonomuraea endophytica]MBB5077244.1 hypothetical protein [Nonomuraea endophytica]
MSYRSAHEELTAARARAWVSTALRGDFHGVHHPLGFVCLPLERTGGDGVCLHLWSRRLPGAGSTTSQIHCHSWDLVSHVLYGQVRNVHAVVTDTPAAEATHQVFEVVSGDDGDRISPTPRTVRHSTGLVEVFGAGDTYTLPADSFHSSVVPEGGEAATIALGSGRTGSRDLSLGPLGAPGHHVARRPLDDGERALAVQLVLTHLGGP